MKGRASEFAWWVPDAGYELLSVMRPRKGAKAEPGLICLRLAGSEVGKDLCISPEAATECLKAHLEKESLEPVRCEPVGTWNFQRAAEGTPGRLYTPLLKYTGLFRSFAAANADAQGFLDFANKYGAPLEECSLLLWHKEVLAMRQALDVWDLLRKREEQALSEHFQWRKVPLVDLEHPESPSTKTWWELSYDSHPNVDAAPSFLDRRTWQTLLIDDRWASRRARPGTPNESVPCPFTPASDFGYADDYPVLDLGGAPDVFTAARFYLAKVINERINEHTFSTFALVEEQSISRPRKAGRRRRPRKDERTKRVRKDVHMKRVDVPRNLLGAMWLQFDYAISGNKEERYCPECKTPFLVARGEARDDKAHCGTACRSKAWRRNVKEAQQRRAKGESVAEIAKHMKADETAVKGWLAYERKKGRKGKKKSRPR
jgi:hypothetical protein